MSSNISRLVRPEELKALKTGDTITDSRQTRLNLIEAERISAIEAAKGTLEDLLQDYINDRSGKLDHRTISEMQRVREKLIAQNPEILCLHASDIRPIHIKELLSPAHKRGSKVMAERKRRQMSASFNYGMKAENVVGRTSDKTCPICLRLHEHERLPYCDFSQVLHSSYHPTAT
ncbi:MAG: hypothetical protein V7751_06570 [Pseudoalteromonas distincta]